MKKIGIITLFAALFCFVASAAMAIPVNWQANHIYQFKFKDYEWWDDTNNNGILNIGEQFHGIFVVTNIYDLNSANPSLPVWGSSISNGQLTGNFTYTITDIVPTSTTGIYTIYMTDKMDMYYDPVYTFNPTWQHSWTASLYGATAGNRWASFNVTTFPFNATVDSSTWPISTILNSSSIATIQNADMYMTYDNTGAIWYQPSTMASNIYWCGYNSTTGSAISNYAAGWEFESNDPISATCNHPVPEPATIMLLGAGLLGLGSWGKKKAKKDKES